MSDNTVLPGTGEIYSSEEITNSDGDAVNYQVIKIGFSEPGKEPVQVSKASPMPVQGTGDTILEKILMQQKLIMLYLEEATGFDFTKDDIEG